MCVCLARQTFLFNLCQSPKSGCPCIHSRRGVNYLIMLFRCITSKAVQQTYHIFFPIPSSPFYKHSVSIHRYIIDVKYSFLQSISCFLSSFLRQQSDKLTDTITKSTYSKSHRGRVVNFNHGTTILFILNRVFRLRNIIH